MAVRKGSLILIAIKDGKIQATQLVCADYRRELEVTGHTTHLIKVQSGKLSN